MTLKEWQPTPETKNAKSKSLKRFVAFCPECGKQVEVNHTKAVNRESCYCSDCTPPNCYEEYYSVQNHYLEKLQLKAFDKIYNGLSRHDRTPEDRIMSLVKSVVVTSDENFNRQVKSPKFRQYLEMEYDIMSKQMQSQKIRLRTKRKIRSDMTAIEQLLS